MFSLLVSALIGALSFLTVPAAAPPDLRTVAEQSNYMRTGRYDEVQRLCAAFAQAWPKQVRCAEFGRTPEGRPMLMLVASADGTLTAAAARAKGRPVVLAQGGIHAGEIDGKDAGFLALRELLEGRVSPGVLGRVTFVFVPVFNVDGHERVSRTNRPNQIGPEEVGWRVTSQNLNLNRDYVKADAPEMQAMLRLLDEWDPIVYADLHVTDGAQFEHDVSINVAPTLVGDAALRQAAVGLRDGLMQRLTSQGSLPLDFYPSFIKDDDPASGFAVTVGPPRFSQEYWAERQRIGILVETHSWKPYPVRVRVTHHAIVGLLDLAAANGPQWLEAARTADRHGAALGGTSVALRYQASDHVRPLEFRGYAYRRETSTISGGMVTHYDPSTPQIWRRAALRRGEADGDRGGAARRLHRAGGLCRPGGGETGPARHREPADRRAAAAPRRPDVPRDAGDAGAEHVRGTDRGHARRRLEGRTARRAGGVAVRADRPAAGPHADDPARAAAAPTRWSAGASSPPRSSARNTWRPTSPRTWPREMLAKDPALRAAFEKRVAEDPAFAKSPSARLDFFYRRHPAWDERHNLYPVYRTASVVP